MATLYTQQDKNVRRTWLLMTTFLVMIVAIGFVFSQAYGNPNILYGFFIFALFMNFFAYWNSAKIALRVSGAKLAGEAEYPELRPGQTCHSRIELKDLNLGEGKKNDVSA